LQPLVNKDCRASVLGRKANTNVCRASVKKRTANQVETVRKCVPCALGKTHGKECLCRTPDRKRTAKFFTHGKARFSRSGSPNPPLMLCIPAKQHHIRDVGTKGALREGGGQLMCARESFLVLWAGQSGRYFSWARLLIPRRDGFPLHWSTSTTVSPPAAASPDPRARVSNPIISSQKSLVVVSSPPINSSSSHDRSPTTDRPSVRPTQRMHAAAIESSRESLPRGVKPWPFCRL
jgi:hypothetical protein